MPSDAVETVATLPHTGPERPRARRLAEFSWLLSWGTKGGLAITDQALFVGSQFAVNILLARWLSAVEYGAFAVAYSVYLLASAAHNALLVEPMIVFGSGRYLQSRKSYFRAVLRGHSLLAIPAGALLFAAGFVLGRWNSRSVAYPLYALGLALPLTLLSELARRAFYVEMRPGRAAIGGATYFFSLLLFVCGLRAEHILTPATAILGMGGAALLTATMQLSWLASHWPLDSAFLPAAAVASEHWAYGRWVLAAVLPSWTFPNLFYWALPARFGLEEAGALKAILNLAMPATHTLIAIGVLTIALFVRHRRAGGYQRMWQSARRITLLFVLGAAVYFAILLFFGVPILRLLYGGRYLEYSGLPLLLAGLVPFVTALSVAAGVALRALERPDRLFWANVAASLVAATVGLGLTITWGAAGAIAGYVASYAACAAASWLFCRRILLAQVRG